MIFGWELDFNEFRWRRGIDLEGDLIEGSLIKFNLGSMGLTLAESS